MDATNSNNNSHLVSIPPGLLPSDVILTSPIIHGEDGDGAAAMAGFGMGGGAGAGMSLCAHSFSFHIQRYTSFCIYGPCSFFCSLQRYMETQQHQPHSFHIETTLSAQLDFPWRGP